jgi:hypothetical protein
MFFYKHLWRKVANEKVDRVRRVADHKRVCLLIPCLG